MLLLFQQLMAAGKVKSVDATTQTSTITSSVSAQTKPMQVTSQIQTRSVACQTTSPRKSTSSQTNTRLSKCKGLQANLQLPSREESIQCNISQPIPTSTFSPVCSDIEVESETDDDDDDDDDGDEEGDNDYMPSSYSIDMTAESCETDSPQFQRKFIVFEPNLLQLFQACPVCQHDADSRIKQQIGSYIVITQSCQNCSYNREWASQPMVNSIPAGNILLSASILFAGAPPSKVI
ncbi:uncharacterized protein [Ptychodera flava]|uniref:uncharacterized protein n=1 Tax=Ptychodera flava TaxID=63121 RepID=UPI00396A1B64